ncbi:uncharacterized protein [Triticum aestivum]|uniref:uncharacterized protein n=1 Tax=Triticum aestivum TaxID=4565 RepID=UPI001D008B1F|nr:uncharacterized protein LOC123122105 [Triticum aestivum]
MHAPSTTASIRGQLNRGPMGNPVQRESHSIVYSLSYVRQGHPPSNILSGHTSAEWNGREEKSPPARGGPGPDVHHECAQVPVERSCHDARPLDQPHAIPGYILSHCLDPYVVVTHSCRLQGAFGYWVQLMEDGSTGYLQPVWMAIQ